MVDTVNSPWGLFISNPFERGTLFKVAKMMVLVLHKELENEVEKLKYKKLEVVQPKIRNKSELPVGELTIPDQSRRSFRVVID